MMMTIIYLKSVIVINTHNKSLRTSFLNVIAKFFIPTFDESIITPDSPPVPNGCSTLRKLPFTVTGLEVAPTGPCPVESNVFLTLRT